MFPLSKTKLLPIPDYILFFTGFLFTQGLVVPSSYQSYQLGITCQPSQPAMEPRTLQELQNVINVARTTNKTVKAIGSLHSITDCICTEGIPVSMAHISHFSFNSDTKLATVGAGSTLQKLVENLHMHGRALTGAPSYGEITVGGAIGTGAHGTSIHFSTTLSEQIVSVTLVDGMGNVRYITKAEEDFKGFMVHLGLLGILYEVTVNTTEQYKLEVRNFPVRDDILWNGNELLNLARSNDHFQFWWFPSSREVVLSIGNRVSVNASGTCETHFISELPKLNSNALSVGLEIMQQVRDDIGLFLIQTYAKFGLYKEVPGRSPIYSEDGTSTFCSPVAVGFSHRMMTNTCKECFWKQGQLSLFDDDSNFALPIEELGPALRTLREIVVEEYPVEFPLNGIYFRFLTRSEAYMALNSERESVSIEWITTPRYDKSQARFGLPAFQAMGQALITKHGGRPHWGKNGLYYNNDKLMYSLHPRLPDFVKVMEKMDPQGIFLNDFGRRVKQTSRKMTVTNEIARHCALNEVCLCENDFDCGATQYYCGSLLNYTVCRDKPNALIDLKARLSRTIIASLVKQTISLDTVLKSLSSYNFFGKMFIMENKARP